MRSSLLVVLSVAVLSAIGIGSAHYFARSSHVLPGLDRSSYTPAATPQHIEALKHDDAKARKEAAAALWQIGVHAKEATPALLTAAKDPDPQVREAAVKALGRTSQGTTNAVPVLSEALKDKAEEVRAAAALALAEIWGAEASPSEEQDSSLQIRRRENAAPAGQGKRQGTGAPDSPRLSPQTEAAARPAISLLAEALRDPNLHVRVNAAKALSEAGPMAQPAITNLMEVLSAEQDEKGRLWAGIALGSIGPAAKAAVPALLDRLRHDPVDGIRGNVAVALGKIHSDAPVVVPALAEAFLREEFGDIRAAVVMGMQYFGPDAKLALPMLQAAAKDPKYQQKKDLLENLNRLLRGMERNLPKE